MGTTGQLFDKPMAELREAFVRARFAQEDVFGKPNIEEWLANQRAYYGSPDHWVHLIERLASKATFDLTRLHEMAVRMPLKRLRNSGVHEWPDSVDACYTDACYTLISGLDERRADVYTTGLGSALHLVVYKRRGVPYRAIAITTSDDVALTPSPRYVLCPATNADFLRVVLDFGLLPDHNPTRMRENARKFLCDTLEAHIGEERGKAEHDFDTAVAVSADGTKIVHADWVVVLGHIGDCSHLHDLKFPAAAFMERKILRLRARRPCYDYSFKVGGPRIRLDGRDDPTVERFFSTDGRVHGQWEPQYADFRKIVDHARWAPPEQKLLELSDGRIFLTHRDQCPSPLPDGGIKVTV